MAEKPVMVIAVDESEHSFYALEWTLDHFFAKSGPDHHPFSVVLVHARRIAASVIGVSGPGVPLPGSGKFITVLETDIKNEAIKTVEKASEICNRKSVNEVRVEVNEGDPRDVICDVVNKYHASILVVGSHGYGAIKRAVLGSVSDYCAHQANCSVMIVKKPRI